MSVSLADLIEKGGIFYDVSGETADEVYKNAIELMKLPSSMDSKAIYNALCDRESFMSTAVGHGIALPHSRMPIVQNESDSRVCIVYPKKPINMPSPDKIPVYVMFIILSENSREHLDILSFLGMLFSNTSFRKMLEKRAKKDDLLKVIQEQQKKSETHRATKYIDQLVRRYPILKPCKNDIVKAFKILTKCFSSKKKLLLAGNGGSAADSDHISGELLKSFVKKRKIDDEFLTALKKVDEETGNYLADKLQGSLPAIPLTTHTALNTASLNDVDANVMFAQQINGLGQAGDVFLGISTSGNSKNIVYAMAVAKAKGLKTIALSGKDGGKLKNLADVSIIVPEQETYKIQELHLPIYHALCLEIEDFFFSE